MIYFIRGKESGNIKIGYSIHPNKRKDYLQTSHYEDLEVIGLLHGSLNDEARIHEMFKEFRIRGEWYSPGERLLNFIRENFPLKNSVNRINDNEFQIIFARPLIFTKNIYINIGSHNIMALTDKDFRFVFGVKGKREALLSWLKSLDGITQESIDEFESLMNN